MFIIDATFEDLRLIATSRHGDEYSVILTDAVTGAAATVKCSPEQLKGIIDAHLDESGEVADELLQLLQPILDQIPEDDRVALRPCP